jgi:hypothetical protein
MSSYFGVPFDLVNGIAGGDIAIQAVENAGQCLSGLERFTRTQNKCQ